MTAGNGKARQARRLPPLAGMQLPSPSSVI